MHRTQTPAGRFPSYRPQSTAFCTRHEISLKEVLIALIRSVDYYNFLLKDHHRKTAIISYLLGNAYGLDTVQMQNLILASSLHDIGALYVTERDKLIEIDVEDPSHHEILGAKILRSFKPFLPISRILRHHHIRYDDVQGGNVSTAEVPLECYILHMADRIDVLSLYKGYGPEGIQEIIGEIRSRIGTVFNPDLEDALMEVTSGRTLETCINQLSFHEVLFNHIDEQFLTITDHDIRDLALVFSQIVDSKSPWTYRHSLTVSMLASRIGMYSGFDEETCFQLEIAGLLHDIGKIGIPSEILDKEGPLDTVERDQMELHALFTSEILGSMEGFEDIASWAGSHHEKHDKSGYPMHIDWSGKEKQIDILAFSDIFSALAEDRPYRAGMSEGKIVDILGSFVPEKLDREIYRNIRKHAGELYSIQKEAGRIAV